MQVKQHLLSWLGDHTPGEYISGPAAMVAVGVAGGIAGATGWTVCYPIDTAKVSFGFAYLLVLIF